ncbi:hypothetical protein ACFPTY_18805 [Halomonas beimenensis]|uniref:Uncharacterized protein n=1 Tax=Halomonas beimenensis TaxID=475662 RepID=A0A291P313_9GAMM|nr:hypothetical protein [Halomonas beimenensis]ATJ81269.1 hypothetical protein BEI_0282 [Halomonas beimenensis]
MWRLGGTLLLAVLVGCQSLPSRLPEAEPAPSAACRWPVQADRPPATLTRVVAALEEEGFLVRHTAPALGLVSAERAERTFYPGHVEPDIGAFVLGGSHGRRGGGVWLGLGAGFGTLSDEATEVERVSVVVGETVQVARDIRLFDWRNELVRSRTASDATFCLDLREAIRRQAGEGAP